MKTPKILMMALVAAFTLTFSSCGDDDKTADVTTDIAATYAGSVDMQVSGRAMGTYDIDVVVASSSASTVTITLPALESDGHNGMPELSVTGVKVTKSGDNYLLAKDDIDITVGETNYTGSLSGAAVGNALSLTYQVKPGAMPMSIDFTFTGTRK